MSHHLKGLRRNPYPNDDRGRGKKAPGLNKRQIQVGRGVGNEQLRNRGGDPG